MGKNKTIYLIDGSAYIYRAYHAIRGLTNSKGLPTNAVFGFTNILTKLIKDKNPLYVVVLFDMQGLTFRHELYKEYKANRPPMPDDLVMQLPYIKKVTRGFNIPIIEKEGFEADDLIGTLSVLGEKQGFEVIMVTGDKDLMQLVTEHVTIWDPMKDVVIDKKYIKEKVGVGPDRIIDVMGLTGDTSDNIPGVPGIGKKIAPLLIKQFGSLDELYENVETITQKKQRENLINFKDQAFLSKQLVTINKEVTIAFDPEKFKYQEPDKDMLFELYKELEFRKHQKELSQDNTVEKNYTAIFDKNALKDLISTLAISEIFVFDTETTSKRPMMAELVGLSFAVKENEAFYIPLLHDDPAVQKQLDFNETLNALKPVLEDENIEKTGQNIKYDWMVLSKYGLNLKGIAFDTMIASYLINPSRRSHGLDQMAMDFLGHKMISYKEVAGTGKNEVTFDKVPVDKAVPYACEDADITLMMYHILSKNLQEKGLQDLFEKIEMPLVPVLMEMETQGIVVDKDRLVELSKKFENELLTIEQNVFSLAGEEFNIKSSQQLGRILFEVLELPFQKKTKKKTGYSTDVDVLTALSEMHELPAYILRYRALTKLKSAYTDNLLELIHQETNRIHTSYNQTVTVTGRLSSSDPNLQNIPIRSEDGIEIRKCFIPQNGWTLIAADYSQIELRILAHYSDDKILIEAFEKDEDIHTRTAEEVFQTLPGFITPDLRRQAKAINFGIIYGMSPYGLSQELSISRKMATTYISNYFNRYKGVKHFIDKTIEESRKNARTSTLLGRVRFLPEINSKNKNIQNFAERAAINTPIQGTAADLIKIAMINLSKTLKEQHMQTKMLLSVHDEIILESPLEEIEKAKEILVQVMENVHPLKVPLKVNIDIGTNWAEAH